MMFLAAAIAAHVLDFSQGVTVTGKRHPVFPPLTAGGPPPPRFYPEQAQLKGLTGEATVRCKVSDPDARIGPCTVVKEAPTGEAFGEKAALLAPFIKLGAEQRKALVDAKGSFQGSEIIIPVHFVLEDDKPAKAPPPALPPAAAPPRSSPGS